MRPYYEDAAVTIYHADCREVVCGLSGVGALATDPPYGIGFNEYASHKDDPSGYPELLLSAIEGSERAMGGAGWCAVFVSATTARDWHRLVPREWRPVALPKTFTQVHPGRAPLWATDYALVWKLGEPEWPEQGARVRDWCIVPTSDMSKRVRGHPCPRPLPAMLHMVLMVSAPGAVVLDPFMGTGTTLVAAKELGRRAIGVEIEERYCEIAARRMSQEVLDFGGAA